MLHFIIGNDTVEAAFINQWLEYRLLNVDRCVNEKDPQGILKVLASILSSIYSYEL